MYVRGKLLFVGHVFDAHSCSARDLQMQISRTRVDYRLGRSLPSDYKFRYCCTTFHHCESFFTPSSLSSGICSQINKNKAIFKAHFIVSACTVWAESLQVWFCSQAVCLLSPPCSHTVTDPAATDAHRSKMQHYNKENWQEGTWSDTDCFWEKGRWDVC